MSYISLKTFSITKFEQIKKKKTHPHPVLPAGFAICPQTQWACYSALNNVPYKFMNLNFALWVLRHTDTWYIIYIAYYNMQKSPRLKNENIWTTAVCLIPCISICTTLLTHRNTNTIKSHKNIHKLAFSFFSEQI